MTKQEKSAYQKAYYAKNRDKLLKQGREYHFSNRDENLKKMKAKYRERYKDPEQRKKILESNKKWIKKNPEVGRRMSLNWRNRNLERARQNTSDWLKKNPTWRMMKNHKRAALLKKASINLAGIKEFVKGVKNRPNFTCYYCQQIFPSSVVHFDHIVALAIGGEHSARNLCTACAFCNHSKHHKSLSDWKKPGQQVLHL